MLQGYVEALKTGSGYQYICDNGHHMSKSELCDIIKEFDYVIGNLSMVNLSSDAYLKYVADSIEENCLYKTEE